jgi:hypothetical protein
MSRSYIESALAYINNDPMYGGVNMELPQADVWLATHIDRPIVTEGYMAVMALLIFELRRYDKYGPTFLGVRKLKRAKEVLDELNVLVMLTDRHAGNTIIRAVRKGMEDIFEKHPELREYL